MGLISKLIRTITAPLKKTLKTIMTKIRREKPSKDEVNVPSSWKKGEQSGPSGSRRVKKEVVVRHPGKLKRIYHFPWLLKFKRGLAAILLLLNLAFSQFILGSQREGQIFFLMFLFNAFVLADYLWKTRRKSE